MCRLILFLTIGLLLYGDIRYEMLTTTQGMMGMGASETTMTIYIKGDRSRTETVSENPMADEVTTITITRLDKQIMWTLDFENQQYSETKLEATPQSSERTVEDVVSTISVEKTGQKKNILGKTCEEIIISINASSDNGNFTMTQTMWVTEDIDGYEELKEFNEGFAGRFNCSQSSATTMGMDEKAYNEFQKKVSEIEGFPLELEMTITIGAGPMSISTKSHSTVTRIEVTPIHEKVFEIPEGFVLVEQ